MNAQTPSLTILSSVSLPPSSVTLKLELGQLIDQAQHLIDQGKMEPAQELYRQWIETNSHPSKHVACFNYGSLLQQMGKSDEAVQAYTACFKLAPNFGHAYINLGLLHEREGRHEKAFEVWSRFVGRKLLGEKLDDEMLCTAYNHIGRLHEEQKRYDLAERALRESLTIKPLQPGVIQHLVHVRQKACTWPVYDTLAGVSLSEQIRHTSPLAMLALTDDPVQQLLSAQSFVQRTYDLREEHLHAKYPRTHTRRRIGIVSGDLREHAVGFLLPSLLRQFDRSNCELYAYDFSRPEDSATRRQILAAFNVVRQIRTLTDAQAAELIAADRIDILIDLHGLSSGARPGIFSRHPAPKQGTYLGFIGTTGMPWLDFVIADRQVLPPELSTHFTERPVYMDGSFIPLSRTPGTSLRATRAEANLPEAAFVMAAFGNVYKITPEMFDSWLRLLRRIEGSILWLLDDNDVTTRNLRCRAQAAGADISRIIFAGRTEPEVFRARLALADVYLDTYPYNCGSTSNDVINAGIPLVTMYGRTMVSRMGLSILHEVGQTDFATTSFVEYENKVVEVWLKGRDRLNRKFSMTVKPSLSSVIKQIENPPSEPREIDSVRTHSSQVKVHIRELPKENTATKLTGWEKSLIRSIDMESIPNITIDILESSSDLKTFYGFLCSEFQNETGLPYSEVETFAASKGASADILLFNPYWEEVGFHSTPFHLAESSHSGSLALMQIFADEAEIQVDISKSVLTTERSIIGNHWLATRSVWISWLELIHKWTTAFNNPSSQLYEPMHKPWANELDVAAGQMLFPLTLNLLLLSRPLSVASHFQYFDKPQKPGKKPLDTKEALMRSALKQAWMATGWSGYLEAMVDSKK